MNEQRSAVEALTQIRALCDETNWPFGPVQIGADKWVPLKHILVILDAVSVDATPLAVVHVEDPTESGDPWCGVIPASDERSVEGWEKATCPECLKAILREPIGENAQIVNGWLVEPDINGEPEPLIDLKRLPGWPVDATPAQGIDRDAARAFLAKLGYADPEVYDIEGMVDELALVRPAEGIALGPEEAALAAEGVSCIATAPRGFYPREKQTRARALQVRLEAAS